MSAVHVLYRMYDHDGALLYVGITLQPPQRFRSHRAEKQWWAEVANIKLEHFEARDDLQHAEVAAIRSESPRYNIANTREGRVKRTPPHVSLEACIAAGIDIPTELIVTDFVPVTR